MNDIKLKIATMRKELNLPPYDNNMDRLKLRILSLTMRLTPKDEVKVEPKEPDKNFNDKLLTLNGVKL
jgi:hypothetical protein|tara:strand:- start:259 stop:462 length:204 start_codon:yes stop_codon:yes gene_type:complete